MQRGVGLETLREVLGGLFVESVISEAARMGEKRVSAAADTFEQKLLFLNYEY